MLLRTRLLRVVTVGCAFIGVLTTGCGQVSGTESCVAVMSGQCIGTRTEYNPHTRKYEPVAPRRPPGSGGGGGRVYGSALTAPGSAYMKKFWSPVPANLRPKE